MARQEIMSEPIAVTVENDAVEVQVHSYDGWRSLTVDEAEQVARALESGVNLVKLGRALRGARPKP